MIKTFTSIFVGIILVLPTMGQQTTQQASFGKGLLNYVASDSSFSVKFAPRMQARYQANSSFDGSNWSAVDHSFLIRRARFKFDGWAVSPKLVYKMEFGLSNNDMSGSNSYTKNAPRYILDAVVKWKFAKNWELWAGQTKMPGNVERVVSSGDLQLIDRSLLNKYFTLDRDMGFQLRHKSKLPFGMVVKEKVAVTQGEGRNIATGNEGGLQYTARLEWLPFGEFAKKGDYVQAAIYREATPKLMLTYTYNFNNNAVKTMSAMGKYMDLPVGSTSPLYQTDITTQFIDGMFKYKGVSAMAEWAKRITADPLAKDESGVETGSAVIDGSSLNAQIGVFVTDKVEVVTRYTQADFENYSKLTDLKQYTIGISKYISGHKLKVQADISYTESNGNAQGILLRTGFDIHF